jgi:hypothetical protein
LFARPGFQPLKFYIDAKKLVINSITSNLVIRGTALRVLPKEMTVGMPPVQVQVM